ncbi:metal ABC transporter permease [Lusitaniella coriacea LEGE 07157]|uniref:Metal ABC transporter permease n=1 Tax=Lusitaniella coriacea LEGE 07157 TaxID=945747 RepID=A0A8J7DWU5_9CYAN|nr:metal ABC transporter permease [Lusitaniella coriacea]MBE9116649.1 metal ABC transporter permease [Lusitaniella coriacea LEGE 07157]
MVWLTNPLQFEFMCNALIIGVLMSILCGVVGSYLVVEHMSLMGNVISHSVLPGLSIAFFFDINLSFGAFIAGTLSALVVAWIRTQSRLNVDTAMALVLSSFLALGVLLIHLLRTNRIDLNQLLFGDILGVVRGDIWQVLIITLAILAIVTLFYPEILYYTFDPLGAQASGLPVNWIYFGFIAAVTLTIIASMQTVGVLLVISLLVGPASTAYLLVKELHFMMGLAAVIGILGNVTGMYLSYYLDLPSGPSIVLVIFSFFLLAFFFSPSQGIFQRLFKLN